VPSPLANLAPARRRQVQVLAGLVAVLVLALVVWLVVRAVNKDGGADQASAGPVLLVPGYGGDTSDLAPLAAAVERQGRQAVIYRPTGKEQGDLRVQARRLSALAKDTMKRTGAPSVDVIGYSAGGVIARLFVRDDGGASVVRRVLTLGSPHHGTDTATDIKDVAGRCPTACEQMATGSELIARLNSGDETPSGPRWITVRTDKDTVVTPTTSARLDGALNIRVQAVCPGADTTHGTLPRDPVVLATIGSALGKGDPRTPAHVTC
jgi:triacylglycerol lipase